MAKKNWKKKQELEELCVLSIQGLETESLKELKTFITSLLRYKKLEKLDTTFVKGPKKAITYNEEPKVYCDFNIDGTVTGRLSCTTYDGNDGNPMGVSFHTLPNKSSDIEINIRDIYGVSNEDEVFITADYSTMELRVLAHLANVKEMKHAFRNKLDLHSHTAGLIFNKGLDEITTEQRKLAKTANFLIVYGGGAPNLAEVVNISVPKAQDIIDRHKVVYPEIHQLIHETEVKLRQFKFVENLFGRRRHLPDIDSKDYGIQLKALRQAFNMLIQSTASDILLCADVSLIREIKKQNLNARIAANVHDSMEVLVKKEDLNKTVLAIYKSMIINPVMVELIGKFGVPFEIELEIGTSFGNGIPYEEYANGKR